MKAVVLIALTAFLLASCEKLEPEYTPLTDETKAWLPDQDGQTVSYTTAAGATQTMQVARRQEVDEYIGKSLVKQITDWEYVVYKRSIPADSGFSLVARVAQITVLNTSAPTRNAFYTSKDLGTIAVEAPQPYQDIRNGRRIKFAFNQTLAGRSYPKLAIVDFAGVDSTATTDINRLQRLYLAKDQGLAAFRTADGRVWLRK